MAKRNNSKLLIAEKKEFSKYFSGRVSCLHTFGRHVVNKSKVVQDIWCHVVNELLNLKVGCRIVSKLRIS
jgi:hypothetical protein